MGKSKKYNRVMLEDGILWLTLTEREGGKKIFWDPESFRPNLQERLEDSIEYKTDVSLDEENLSNGRLVRFPRSITIYFNSSEKTFVNVR